MERIIKLSLALDQMSRLPSDTGCAMLDLDNVLVHLAVMVSEDAVTSGHSNRVWSLKLRRRWALT